MLGNNYDLDKTSRKIERLLAYKQYTFHHLSKGSHQINLSQPRIQNAQYQAIKPPWSPTSESGFQSNARSASKTSVQNIKK